MSSLFFDLEKEKIKVKKKLKALGIQPKRALGQNFLIGEEVIQKIFEKIEKSSPKKVIEIGPGLGALTHVLQKKVSSIQVIEMDCKISKFWRDQNVSVIEKNVLDVNLNPLDFDLIIGNLPFSIASRLLIQRSLDSLPESEMIFMFQKEVAERILSPPKRKTYGLLSVFTQIFWEMEFVVEALPQDFYPSPKVSAYVLFFKRNKRFLKDSTVFLHFIKQAFSHRRKYLVKNIRAFLGPLFKEEEKFAVEDCFCELGLDLKVRAEELSPSLFFSLFQKLCSLLNMKISTK